MSNDTQLDFTAMLKKDATVVNLRLSKRDPNFCRGSARLEIDEMLLDIPFPIRFLLFGSSLENGFEEFGRKQEDDRSCLVFG